MSPLRKLGPVHTRMLKLQEIDKLMVPMSSGSEPEVENVLDEDDTVLYGVFPATDDRCEKNRQRGHHEYDHKYFDSQRCIHCNEWDR